MSLPAPWVEKIFEQLTVKYGRDFLSRWEGMNLNDVKTDWAQELAGFLEHPSAIAYALANLPIRPPTVIEFRAIARLSPAEQLPRIEVSKAGKERIEAELKKLAPVLKARKAYGGGNLDWAHRIVARAADGDVSRSPLPLKMAREAIANGSKA